MSNVIPFPKQPKKRGFALLAQALDIIDFPDSEDCIFWMGEELYAFASDHPNEERCYRPLIERKPQGSWQDWMARE